MAAYDLEEQEQIDELKAYWKQYGNLIMSIVIAVLFAFSAVQGWNWYQRKQAAEASNYFVQLQKAQASKDLKQVKGLSGSIIEQYPRTYYAAMAALIAAKAYYDANDVKSAKAQFEWAMEHAKTDEFRDIARLRLGYILLDEKDYDGALKLADEGVKTNTAYLARFSDLKGDVLVAQNKTADAKTAYQAALNAIDSKDTDYKNFVQQKLDSLGAAS